TVQVLLDLFRQHMVILLEESQLQKKEEFKARKFLVLITVFPRIRAVLRLIASTRIIAPLLGKYLN
ncbi:MAG: hypothetical protein MI923_20810, partial [Phycisphaerales bacterium]|nr:hypothetical protein [Phycisphaerales bacterium]